VNAAPVRALILATFALSAGAAVAGCPELPPVKLCGEIPSGGCPVGRGGSCDDATCAGLYDCVDGKWTLTQTCSGDGGPRDGGDDGGDGGDGGCTPTNLDPDGGAAGCTPDLQNPDCPAAAAECAEQACTTGCVDFWLCTSTGWSAVAYCDDNGNLVIQKP
jgi:hypothetical protein